MTIKMNYSVLGLDSYNSSEVLALVPLYENYSDALLTVATVICAFLMCIGIPGNLITIIALTQYKKVQNATAIFIINLHLSDLIFCCTILPLVAATFWEKHWVFGKTICRLFPMIRLSLYMVGMFLILAISINRCIIICHPLWYPRIYTRRNIRIMLATIWVIGCLILLPTFLEAWGRFSLDSKVGLCSIVPDRWDRSPKMFLISTFSIPSIIMPVCYARIWWVSRKISKKSRSRATTLSSTVATQETIIEVSSVQDDTEISDSGSQFKRANTVAFRRTVQLRKPSLPTKKDKRLGTMIIVIMSTFYMCAVPYVIVKSVGGSLKQIPEFNMCGYLLFFATTSVNPLIYVVLSKEYRQAYKYLLKRIKRKCSRGGQK